MRKLYGIFKVLKIQKRIVSAETIGGNTVDFCQKNTYPINFLKWSLSNYHSEIDFLLIAGPLSYERPAAVAVVVMEVCIDGYFLKKFLIFVHS